MITISQNIWIIIGITIIVLGIIYLLVEIIKETLEEIKYLINSRRK